MPSIRPVSINSCYTRVKTCVRRMFTSSPIVPSTPSFNDSFRLQEALGRSLVDKDKFRISKPKIEKKYWRDGNPKLEVEKTNKTETKRIKYKSNGAILSKETYDPLTNRYTETTYFSDLNNKNIKSYRRKKDDYVSIIQYKTNGEPLVKEAYDPYLKKLTRTKYFDDLNNNNKSSYFKKENGVIVEYARYKTNGSPLVKGVYDPATKKGVDDIYYEGLDNVKKASRHRSYDIYTVYQYKTDGSLLEHSVSSGKVTTIAKYWEDIGNNYMKSHKKTDNGIITQRMDFDKNGELLYLEYYNPYSMTRTKTEYLDGVGVKDLKKKSYEEIVNGVKTRYERYNRDGSIEFKEPERKWTKDEAKRLAHSKLVLNNRLTEKDGINPKIALF